MKLLKRLLRRVPGAVALYHLVNPWGKVPPGHMQFCNTRRGGDCDCFVRWDANLREYIPD